MRVLIDALFLRPGQNGGGETYIRELLAALAQVDGESDYVVLAAAGAEQAFGQLGPNFRIHATPLASGSVPWRLVYEQLLLPFMVRKLRPNVVFFPANMIALPIALLGIPTVCTIHDASFDFFQTHFAADYSRFQLRLKRVLARWAARYSTRVVAISAFTRKEISRMAGGDAGNVAVVYSGTPRHQEGTLDAGAVLTRYHIAEPYVLAVGRVHRHKNCDRLVRAFARLKQHGLLPHHLVIAGAPDTGQATLEAAIAGCGGRAYIHLTGFVGGDDLAALYGRATAFIMPSLYEGFGLPVLEAMRFGIPTAAANVCALPEIGGDAAAYFDPNDEHAMAACLERLLTDGQWRSELARKGLVQAAKFQWADTARQMLAVFRSAFEVRNGRTQVANAEAKG